MTLRCRLGWHRWGLWYPRRDGSRVRSCDRCPSAQEHGRIMPHGEYATYRLDNPPPTARTWTSPNK